MKKIYILSALLSITSINFIHAQVGPVIWQENFDNLDNWIKETGNGYWGWGNGELEFYKADNAVIAPIPGDPGSSALRITAKQESGPGIVDQWGNALNYTSGKVNTKSKITIQYGVIETRVMVPNINLGGWPAVWLLGNSNLNWPRKGEIDMMEMGHQQAFRNLHDTHNGGNGLNNATVNQMVGANAIFYSDDAVNAQNPSGAASISYDPDDDFVRPYYNYSSPLNNRFLTYRLYWDADSMRFTVTDNGTEYDLYTSPFMIDSVSDEFRQPFYLIANLAIGGAFTDAYNLGDPGSGSPVTMPFPVDMYVDYIKVMQWNGQGEVHVGPPTAQNGTYGIFTDNTPTNAGLTPGLDAEIFVWEGTLATGSIPPFEGPNGITWTTTGKGWFGAGILSLQPVNLFNFGAGNLKFRIKIPSNVTFKIGIIDAWGNQNYVTFPANQTTYGLVRDGNWGQACIPVSDIRGLLIDLRMLSYEFVILEENGAFAHFALDDIYWEDGIINTDSLSTTDVSHTQATLNWIGNSSASGYIITGGKVGGPSISLPVGTATSFTVNNLDPDQAYYWTLATDLGVSGIVHSMQTDTFTTLSCDPPALLSTTNITSSSARLNWTLADNASGYQIFGSQVGSGNVATINISNDLTSHFDVSGLSPGTTYQWAIRSNCNGFGYSDLSSVASFATSIGPASKHTQPDQNQLLWVNDPSVDFIQVRTYGEDRISAMNIYSVNGQLVEQLNVQSNEVRVNTGGYQNGIYFVDIQTGNGVFRKKFIVAGRK